MVDDRIPCHQYRDWYCRLSNSQESLGKIEDLVWFIVQRVARFNVAAVRALKQVSKLIP